MNCSCLPTEWIQRSTTLQYTRWYVVAVQYILLRLKLQVWIVPKLKIVKLLLSLLAGICNWLHVHYRERLEHFICLCSCPLKHSSVHVCSTVLWEQHGCFILTIVFGGCPSPQHRSSFPQQVILHHMACCLTSMCSWVRIWDSVFLDLMISLPSIILISHVSSGTTLGSATPATTALGVSTFPFSLLSTLKYFIWFIFIWWRLEWM